MRIGSWAQAFYLLAAAAPLAAESHGVGRRLRLRGIAEHDDSSRQWPLMPAAQFAAHPPRPPVVHFLFLAVGKVNNIDVWKAFFARAPSDKFRAYVHCKVPECTASVADSPLVPIPTVPSFYCADLVTPMNQLLTLALHGPGQNPRDKFVFVSDSTLPGKPFSYIYDTLVARTGSDFCVCSVKEWATRRENPLADTKEGKPVEMAVKHHQWSILERSHAEKVSAIWLASNPMVHDFLMRFQMNLPPRSRSVKTFSGSSDTGCLDEFYHFSAIYGTLPYVDSKNDTLVSLPAFTNAPLHVAASTDLQGSCDTFVAWPAYAKGRDAPFNMTGSSAFSRLYTNLDPLSVPYSGDAQKPGYWDTISSHGMRTIRSSEFLFVRKFADAPRVADGGKFSSLYPQLVFQ